MQKGSEFNKMEELEEIAITEIKKDVLSKKDLTTNKTYYELCSNCNSYSISRQEGCKFCNNCGYSPCG